MAQKWERPRILDMNALPTAVGHCVAGETEFETECVNGGSTNEIDTIPREPHYCANGGYAGESYGGCNTGNDVVAFNAGTGT